MSLVEGRVLKDVAGFKLDGAKITIGVEDFDKPDLAEEQGGEFAFKDGLPKVELEKPKKILVKPKQPLSNYEMILLNKLDKVYNWQVKRDKSTTTCALMKQMGSFKHSEALEKDIYWSRV
ncbi:hypothetical protein VNO80_25189 [Phaseolus coccineus]|uniref:Uncharacterized protein n=1 Tax=Phaseolus coccineus TaxID=3886 RepID=A0AAN9QNJ1_PHACN